MPRHPEWVFLAAIYTIAFLLNLVELLRQWLSVHKSQQPKVNPTLMACLTVTQGITALYFVITMANFIE